jgi:hypothetical protein
MEPITIGKLQEHAMTNRPSDPDAYRAPARREAGVLTDTELALAATIADLVDKIPDVSAYRTDALNRALMEHAPVIMEAVKELRDVRTALAGVLTVLEGTYTESNAFSEPLSSIHTNLGFVLSRVRYVLRDSA